MLIKSFAPSNWCGTLEVDRNNFSPPPAEILLASNGMAAASKSYSGCRKTDQEQPLQQIKDGTINSWEEVWKIFESKD